MAVTPLLRRLYLTAAGAALCTALLLAADRTPEAPVPPEENKTSPGPSTLSPVAYVGEWQGRLAVFREGASAPEEVLEVFVASLPKADREALKAGIPVRDEEELQKLLEDLSG